jgi:hypothetical protein
MGLSRHRARLHIKDGCESLQAYSFQRSSSTLNNRLAFMGSQDPPFPSFSFVLSQAHPTYSSPTPAHLVFPWTSITYHPPNIPANPNPSPAVCCFLCTVECSLIKSTLSLRLQLLKAIAHSQSWLQFVYVFSLLSTRHLKFRSAFLRPSSTNSRRTDRSMYNPIKENRCFDKVIFNILAEHFLF